MSHKSTRLAPLSLAMLSGLLAAVLGLPATAQVSCDKDRKVTARALPEATFNKLNKIYEQIGNEQYAEAAADLNKMLEKSSDDYEKALLHQALGHISSSQDKIEDSLRHFRAAVDLNTLPNLAHFQMIYVLAQLQIALERYEEGLRTLDEWFCVTPPEQITADAYVLKANANAQLKRYRPALEAIDKAIGLSPDPKENWYQLKLAMHFELEQFPQAASTLEIMINKWPDKKQYWTQLSQVYLKIKEDRKSLAVMALAYRRGLLETESEYQQLANLYQYLDLPYQAGVILEEAIGKGKIASNYKHWKQTAETWYQSRELDKSLAAYEKAGSYADDGKLHMSRAYILVDLERWPEAAEAIAAALNKGGLTERETANSYLLKGMAEMKLKRYDAAQQSFTKASNYSNTRDGAREWLRQLREVRSG